LRAVWFGLISAFWGDEDYFGGWVRRRASICGAEVYWGDGRREFGGGTKLFALGIKI
jgi:hypothetical protein